MRKDRFLSVATEPETPIGPRMICLTGWCLDHSKENHCILLDDLRPRLEEKRASVFLGGIGQLTIRPSHQGNGSVTRSVWMHCACAVVCHTTEPPRVRT